MEKKGKFKSLNYIPAKYFMGTLPTILEDVDVETLIHVGCFMSAPTKDGYGPQDPNFLNMWMCFTDEQAILNFINDIRDQGGKIDPEYSFIIKPGRTYMERTPLVDFLEDNKIDVDSW